MQGEHDGPGRGPGDDDLDLTFADGRFAAGEDVLDWLDAHRAPFCVRAGDAALRWIALETLFREVTTALPRDDDSDEARYARGYLVGFREKVRNHLGIVASSTHEESPS